MPRQGTGYCWWQHLLPVICLSFRAPVSLWLSHSDICSRGSLGSFDGSQGDGWTLTESVTPLSAEISSPRSSTSQAFNRSQHAHVRSQEMRRSPCQKQQQEEQSDVHREILCGH